MASSSVYSAAFVVEAGLDGTVEVTVPDGRVWILRDLDVVALFDGTGYAILQGGGGQRIWERSQASTDKAGPFEWRGRQVVTAGLSVAIETSGGGWDVSLSGYTLLAA